jgi:hypothetical protein
MQCFITSRRTITIAVSLVIFAVCLGADFVPDSHQAWAARSSLRSGAPNVHGAFNRPAAAAGISKDRRQARDQFAPPAAAHAHQIRFAEFVFSAASCVTGSPARYPFSARPPPLS